MVESFPAGGNSRRGRQHDEGADRDIRARFTWIKGTYRIPFIDYATIYCENRRELEVPLVERGDEQMAVTVAIYNTRRTDPTAPDAPVPGEWGRPTKAAVRPRSSRPSSSSSATA